MGSAARRVCAAGLLLLVLLLVGRAPRTFLPALEQPGDESVEALGNGEAALDIGGFGIADESGRLEGGEDLPGPTILSSRGGFAVFGPP
jgi:hypothetical protein